MALPADSVARTSRTSRWVDREAYTPSTNVCPGRRLPVVYRADGGGRTLHTMAFGLVPSYQKAEEKPDFFRMMNARSETAASKPAFRRLVSARRCAVPIQGFYEWRQEQDGRRQPFFVTPARTAEGQTTGVKRESDSDARHDDPVLWLAALYDEWARPDAEQRLYSFTILTTEAAPDLAWLHERMPAVLATDAAVERWLDVGRVPAAIALQDCVPCDGLRWHPVHPRVGKVSYQGADACARYEPIRITAFFGKGRAAGAGWEDVAREAASSACAPAADGSGAREADAMAMLAATPHGTALCAQPVSNAPSPSAAHTPAISTKRQAAAGPQADAQSDERVGRRPRLASPVTKGNAKANKQDASTPRKQPTQNNVAPITRFFAPGGSGGC